MKPFLPMILWTELFPLQLTKQWFSHWKSRVYRRQGEGSCKLCCCCCRLSGRQTFSLIHLTAMAGVNLMKTSSLCFGFGGTSKLVSSKHGIACPSGFGTIPIQIDENRKMSTTNLCTTKKFDFTDASHLTPKRWNAFECTFTCQFSFWISYASFHFKVCRIYTKGNKIWFLSVNRVFHPLLCRCRRMFLERLYAYLDTALTIDHQIHFFDLHSICLASNGMHIYELELYSGRLVVDLLRFSGW